MRSPARGRPLLGLLTLCVLAATGRAPAQAPARPLLIAFSSFRDRPLHPRVYFYRHDGIETGALDGSIEPENLRVETRSSLAQSGRLVACASELENQPSNILLWDRQAKQTVPAEGLNSESPEVHPSLSADGRTVVCQAWQRPGLPAHWSLFLYDLKERKPLPTPMNTDDDELQPALSGDGRYLAFASNRPGGQGLLDLYLYDLRQAAMVPLPGLNSARNESYPALSNDASLIAFTSDRPGGAGSLDVYLYELRTARLLPLPALNGPGPDQTPAITGDGMIIAFASERATGAGERDILIYDRDAHRLIKTPGLNGVTEDFDPAVTRGEMRE